MSDSKGAERTIIESALKAATPQDAVAVAEMIERHIGARHQRPVGDRFNNYGADGVERFVRVQGAGAGDQRTGRRAGEMGGGKMGDLGKRAVQSSQRGGE